MNYHLLILLKSLRNQLKCAELKNQLKERDLKIEELNYTIRQISQDKMNPTELFLNTPLEKSIISPFQPQESTHSRPSRASIQNTLKSFPRPHLFDDSSMESTNTDDSTTTRNLRISTGMEIDEEEEYTTPPPPQQQSNPNTNMNGNGRVVVVNRLSNPLPTSPPPFVSNLHTPSPPPPPVSTRTISSAATITAGSITSATSSLSLPSQQQQRQLLQFDYSSEDNNIDIDYVDPDNMTYDELIQLGQRIGDVATEQWKMKCKPIINSLPLHKWLDDDDDDNDECAICTTKYILGEYVRELPCKHFYHKECIDEWLSTHKFCPLCKKNIIDSP